MGSSSSLQLLLGSFSLTLLINLFSLLHLESHHFPSPPMFTPISNSPFALTTNGSFLFLVLLSSLNLSISDSTLLSTPLLRLPSSDSSFQIGLHLLFPLHCLIHPQPFSSVKHGFPHCLSSCYVVFN
ncbi:unnamed protein product [Microthlaspi erraticum]|uniref:Uncharacterized protein n=1 Tax=Microthlaspi erraticum TaxID=1685480 RepID=A0A6D2HTX9_9BRAS|nr:unnamed protein product [Microthlaspi erraticum]